MSTASLHVRILLSAPVNLGPGKVRLLQAIGETGSISGAARQLKISYRRAWLMVDTLNKAFPESLVTTSAGGVKGGGAQLSLLGQTVLERYQDLQMKAERMLDEESADLLALLAPAVVAS
jgi:molybdate transport system regulatory protein